MTASTPAIHIKHIPYGEQRPYHRLPYERNPRDPASGEAVLLGVETGPSHGAERLWCEWWSDDNPEIRHVEGEMQPGGEAGDLWLVQLPAFSGGEVVRYRFYASSQHAQISSDEFTFSVSTWVDAISIAAVVENADRLVFLLETDRPGLFVRMFMEPDSTGSIVLRLTSQHGIGIEKPEDLHPPLITTNWDELRVSLMKSPLQIAFQRLSDGLILQTTGPIQVLVDASGKVTQYRLGFDSPPDEAFYGFGERFNALDQRGNKLINYVYAQYIDQGECSYIPVPFFISLRGYGLWLKTDRQAYFDLAAEDNGRWTLTGQAEEVDACLDLQLFLQPGPQDIIRAFTDLVGKPKLPPSWVFGLWMSSNDWNSQAEIERQLSLARQHDIPASVVVIEAWSDEITFYIWNDAKYELKPAGQAFSLRDFHFPCDGLWPDPKAMVDRLHAQGMRLVLWQIPVLKNGEPAERMDKQQMEADQAYAIQQDFVVRRTGGSPHRIEAHSPWFTSSLVFDFTNPKAAEWWLKRRAYLVNEIGVDGFKTDGGEHIWDTDTRFHNGLRGNRGINTYPLAYESAYHHFMQEWRGSDHVLFSRSGYTGIQHYSCHWTGDEASNWEAYRASLRAMLNAGLCGISFIGWDIAGFAGEIPSSELYLRAAAFSVFCPIMQYHSDYNARRKPSRDRTPWNIQERSGDLQVIPAFRKLVNLRMNLIPYIMAQAQASSKTGLPLMRLLALEYPQDTTCRKYPYQYFFGDALLVAPVAEEGCTTLETYLPEGEWSDLWTGKCFHGCQVISEEVPFERIPVFQRAGSMVALNLGEDLELCTAVGNSTESIDHLAVLVFPGRVCETGLYQGKEHGWAHIKVREAVNGILEIQAEGLELALDLLVLGDKPADVRLEGEPLSPADDDRQGAFWAWLPDRHALRVRIPEGKQSAALRVVYG